MVLPIYYKQVGVIKVETKIEDMSSRVIDNIMGFKNIIILFIGKNSINTLNCCAYIIGNF